MKQGQQILLAAVSVALLAALAGPAPASAGSRPCAESDSASSEGSDAPSAITVTNRRSTPLTIEWGDGPGVVTHFLTLAPDESKLLRTNRSYGWMSRDARRRCLSRFVSEKEPETWEITTTLADDYERKNVGSFPVYVAPEFKGGDRSLLERCLQVLESDVKRIQEVLPKAALQKLSGIPIWLEYEPDPSYGALYLASEEWLVANGMTRAKAKSIQFTSSLAVLVGSEQNPLMHELAHAYHDLILSHSYAPIWSAYMVAQASGLYNAVRHSSGRWQRAYAMSDYTEFFAELSVAYFGTNDLFPFTREDLRKFDPDSYRVISDAWERPRLGPSTPLIGRDAWFPQFPK